MSNVSTDNVRSWREQALAATVHRACTSCGAPGIYNNLDWVYASFPGCYVEAVDERVNQPVGNVCPNCKANRNPGLIEKLGEIWRRRFV